MGVKKRVYEIISPEENLDNEFEDILKYQEDASFQTALIQLNLIVQLRRQFVKEFSQKKGLITIIKLSMRQNMFLSKRIKLRLLTISSKRNSFKSLS